MAALMLLPAYRYACSSAPCTLDTGLQYPVMFWIHGGHFEFGSGEGPLYDSTPNANLSSVVVVTINYRLGALGWVTLPVRSHDVRDQAISAPASCI